MWKFTKGMCSGGMGLVLHVQARVDQSRNFLRKMSSSPTPSHTFDLLQQELDAIQPKVVISTQVRY